MWTRFFLLLTLLVLAVPVQAATYECPGGVYTDRSGPGCHKLRLDPPATAKDRETVQRDESLFEQQRNSKVQARETGPISDESSARALDTQDQTCTLYREYVSLESRRVSGLGSDEIRRLAALQKMFSANTPTCYYR